MLLIYHVCKKHGLAYEWDVESTKSCTGEQPPSNECLSCQDRVLAFLCLENGFLPSVVPSDLIQSPSCISCPFWMDSRTSIFLSREWAILKILRTIKPICAHHDSSDPVIYILPEKKGQKNLHKHYAWRDAHLARQRLPNVPTVNSLCCGRQFSSHNHKCRNTNNFWSTN